VFSFATDALMAITDQLKLNRTSRSHAFRVTVTHTEACASL